MGSPYNINCFMKCALYFSLFCLLSFDFIHKKQAFTPYFLNETQACSTRCYSHICSAFTYFKLLLLVFCIALIYFLFQKRSSFSSHGIFLPCFPSESGKTTLTHSIFQKGSSLPYIRLLRAVNDRNWTLKEVEENNSHFHLLCLY